MALRLDVSTPDEEPLRRPAPPQSWRERVEQVADATGTTPTRIVVGGVVVIVVALAALWLTRPPPPPVEVALPFASTTVTLAAAPGMPTASTPLIVHVAGAVVHPGVHELPAGSRVDDAIAAAGGLTLEADGGRINLAAPVSDGERIYVPKVGEDAPPVAVGSSPVGGGTAAGGVVNLNQADVAALDALPGIGPATAAAIIEHRDRIGRFTSVDQLLDVRGIGEAKLEQLRALVTV
ncbi:MAG: helix-hairpin-helix domain-containing protein [Microthrixaceae bacterium]